jgi:hypothetical protein
MSNPLKGFQTRQEKRIDESKVCNNARFTAAIYGLRPMFLQLRAENPTWSVDVTRQYMFDNSDEFRDFWTDQPSAAELITSIDPKADQDLAELVAIREQRESGQLTLREGFDLLFHKDHALMLKAKEGHDKIVEEHGTQDAFIEKYAPLPKALAKRQVRRRRDRAPKTDLPAQ